MVKENRERSLIINMNQKPAKQGKKKIAFKEKHKNFSVIAYYLEDENPNALIVVKKDNKIYKKFEYPAYRIWNIAAHFSEMVENELYEN